MRDLNLCSECESEYYIDSSEMSYLCPECSFHLYNYENCLHDFKNGRCIHCHWNGNTSVYVRSLKEK